MFCTGLIKVCLAYEHGMLPGNLHFKEPNPNSESLQAGILKVRARSGFHLAVSCQYIKTMCRCPSSN